MRGDFDEDEEPDFEPDETLDALVSEITGDAIKVRHTVEELLHRAEQAEADRDMLTARLISEQRVYKALDTERAEWLNKAHEECRARETAEAQNARCADDLREHVELGKNQRDELLKAVMLAVLNIDCERNGLTPDGNVRERLVAVLTKFDGAI